MANTKKKAVKPQFKVDLTNAESGADVYAAIIEAKIDNGVSVTPAEVVIYMNQVIDDTTEQAVYATINEINKLTEAIATEKADSYEAKENTEMVEVERPSMLKRLWNWIRRK